MQDQPNVVEIPSDASHKTRQRRIARPFEKHIRDQLYVHQDTAREALAIAELLHDKFLEANAGKIDVYELETLCRGLSGIRRLLGEIRGLGEPDELVRQIERQEARDY